MKKLKFLGIIALVALTMVSCKRWINPDINIDPDSPTDASLDLMLPGIEASLAYYIGGFDIAGTPAIWMQQITGSDRQASAINVYIYRESDPNNLWGSMYAGVMMDLKTFIAKAEDPAQLSRNVAGVGKVLLALALGNMTDLWGDMPYSEAFQGGDNLTPAYDSQQDIYTEINNLLTAAIDDLGSTDPLENVFGIENDYIYGGDPSLWQKAAYTLRARYQMHLAKVQSVNYTNVLSDLANGLSDISEDMEQPFDVSASGQNPLYQYVTQRSGYVSNSMTYYGFMEGDSNTYGVVDPRTGVNDWSGSGFWTAKDAPVAMVQYTEALFLKAEAEWRNGDYAAARQSLKDAVNSSMNKYGVSDATWTTAFEADVDATADADLLELIINQKYRHMFCQLEAWTDWRRTGFPQLTPTSGSDIPRRYPYPTDEQLYNSANVPQGVTIFSRVWWDTP